jgi:hypothetical protein
MAQKIITIERFDKIELKNFVFNIGSICVLIDFHCRDIGDGPYQKILQYDILMQQGDSEIKLTNLEVKKNLIDTDKLVSSSAFWSIENWSRSKVEDSLIKVNLHFNLFSNVTMKIIYQDYELKYFLYEGATEDGSDWINGGNNHILELQMHKDIFENTIKMARVINSYAQRLLATNQL